jgi:UDP:flavonoid glycosyltransferase YjiC (YdhE family)
MAAKSILYISGSIGLGHVYRDLSIADELRRLVPQLEVKWLATEPATGVLEAAGETLLPEASLYENDSTIAENTANGVQLNLVDYALRARQQWSQNVELYRQVIERESFDAVVADEAYEIFVAGVGDPSIRYRPSVMIYDFLGLDSKTFNPIELVGAYYLNRIWAKVPWQDLVIFVGELEDIPDRSFGFLLPNRRQYAARYYHPVGYVLPFDPEQYLDTARIRERLGYGSGPLVVCAIGGTAIGKELLELCARAYPILRDNVPDLQMVLVCGPRLSPDSLEGIPAGVEVKGYVPALYEHFAASDLAIVQGGSTTTLELTALRRPFIFFPLEGHFEQENVVGERLARHQAGIRMSVSQTTPQRLAEPVMTNMGQPVTYSPIPVDGAQKAAGLIADLL